MPELTAADLSGYTKGRLADNADTQGLLDAALRAARRYCGWTVCPVFTVVDDVVDGPGGRVLSLPTLNLITVTDIVENGVSVDVSRLDVSRRKGTIEKHPYGWWTSRAGGIIISYSHGFTEAEAADWRRAVLRLANLMDLDDSDTQRTTPDLVRKRIDDVEYQWAEGIISSDERLSALFASYRILPSP